MYSSIWFPLIKDRTEERFVNRTGYVNRERLTDRQGRQVVKDNKKTGPNGFFVSVN